jgi:hypothetical protein
MLIFWVPFSRLFPNVAWPTRAVALFMWVFFGYGELYIAYCVVFKAKTRMERWGLLLIAFFVLGIGIASIMGGTIGSIVAWIIIVVAAITSFVVPRLRSG